MQGYTGNADFATSADDTVAVRQGAEVVGCERADAGFYAEGRYYGTGADAATQRTRAAEKAQREAERRAQHAARQREAAQAAAPAVELKRLQAAATLSCRPAGPTQYLVVGGAESHYVDLSAEGAALVCDCADRAWRGDRFRCKHILAALSAEGDAEIRAALESVRRAA